ncbi:MAG: RtcB family protein, partial [Bacteroidota bacterium]
MKKLKISGKDLRKAGIKNDRAASITKNVLQKHYKQLRKKDALEIVKKIINNPDKYWNHPELGQVAEAVKTPQKTASKSVKLSETKPYSIYGENHIEAGALDQMETAMKLPISVKGSLMPDAHQGYGLPIGGVLATKNEVIPYGVGMDIGCRMCMSIFPIDKDYIQSNTSKLKNILDEHTRFGRSEFNEKKEHSIMDREELKEISFLRTLKKKAYDQLGTSGHGNHFVDIGIVDIKESIKEKNLSPGKYFAILSHSGSRGTGAEIARYYTKVA